MPKGKFVRAKRKPPVGKGSVVDPHNIVEKGRKAKRIFDVNAGTLTLAFESGQTFEAKLEDLPQDMLRRAALEGLSRKLGTGLYLTDVTDPHAWAQACYASLQHSQWNSGRTGGQISDMLISAMAMVDTEKRSPDQIRKAVDKRIRAEIKKAGADGDDQEVFDQFTKAVIAGFKKDPHVKAKLAELRASRAVSAAGTNGSVGLGI